ncbi:hypothetical protein FPQ18DRAFT_258600, partial [Pyronema domesticum]
SLPIPSVGIPSALPSIVPTLLPSISIPSVSVPSVPLPSVIPSVSVPSVAIPSVSVPVPSGSAIPSIDIPISSGESSSVPSTATPSEPVSTGIPSTTEPPLLPPTTTTTPTPPTTIIPASSGVDSSSIWFQTSTLVVAPSPTTTISTDSTADPTTVAMPTATAMDPKLPKLITPAGGMPKAPKDMILIRLGFTHPLNYQWVVSNPISVAQIFEYVPLGVNYGLKVNNVIMHSLQPYDTRLNKGYITTLALAFIPKDMFDELDLQRRTPGSRLLNNPQKAVHDIMALLDPSIPLRASLDEQMGDGNGQLTDNGSNWNNGGGNGNGGSKDASPIQNNTGSISVKSIGIGAGVVAGALAYGGAMLFVARRYRQRRNKHNRASSISRGGSPPMVGPPMTAVAGAAMMHGARPTLVTIDRGSKESSGRNSGGAPAPAGGATTARGANISGPLMAANSLGWS